MLYFLFIFIIAGAVLFFKKKNKRLHPGKTEKDILISNLQKAALIEIEENPAIRLGIKSKGFRVTDQRIIIKNEKEEILSLSLKFSHGDDGAVEIDMNDVDNTLLYFDVDIKELLINGKTIDAKVLDDILQGGNDHMLKYGLQEFKYQKMDRLKQQGIKDIKQAKVFQFVFEGNDSSLSIKKYSNTLRASVSTKIRFSDLKFFYVDKSYNEVLNKLNILPEVALIIKMIHFKNEIVSYLENKGINNQKIEIVRNIDEILRVSISDATKTVEIDEKLKKMSSKETDRQIYELKAQDLPEKDQEKLKILLEKKKIRDTLIDFKSDFLKNLEESLLEFQKISLEVIDIFDGKTEFDQTLPELNVNLKKKIEQAKIVKVELDNFLSAEEFQL